MFIDKKDDFLITVEIFSLRMIIQKSVLKNDYNDGFKNRRSSPVVTKMILQIHLWMIQVISRVL